MSIVFVGVGDGNDDIIIIIIHVLLKYDCFKKCRQCLAVISYALFRVAERRVILRQGHVGQNFYLVYSGSVFVNVDDVTSSGDRFTKTEAVLSRGDSFGVNSS